MKFHFFLIININNIFIFLIIIEVNYIIFHAHFFHLYASPGAKIYEVCKTGNYDLIPIYSCIVSVFNCISWFIHGLFLEDINIIIPNGSGIVLAIVQVLVWGVFYKKNKNKKILDTQIMNTPKNEPLIQEKINQNNRELEELEAELKKIQQLQQKENKRKSKSKTKNKYS